MHASKPPDQERRCKLPRARIATIAAELTFQKLSGDPFEGWDTATGRRIACARRAPKVNECPALRAGQVAGPTGSESSARGLTSEMNERPQLGGGQGARNDRYWVGNAADSISGVRGMVAC